MLKILILLPQIGSDGITNSTLLYMENMNKTDMDIHIGIASRYECDLNNQIERIEALRLGIHFFPSRNRETLKYCVMLKKYLKENRIGILHVMGNSATMAIEMTIAKNCKVPVRIVHCHNTKCKHEIANFLLKPILYKTATNFFSCGIDAGRFLYGNRKFTVIPNGKVINRFLFDMKSREKIREELHVSSKKIIGHVGKFTAQKNHIFLIDVFAELCKMSSDYELWLVGEGGEKEKEIYKKIRDCGLINKIKLLGFRQDVEKVLSAMDIMVFPSLYEGLPNVVLEWQIAQLPCILSDTITQECKIMENVKYLPLEIGAIKWAEEIMNVQEGYRGENQKLIIEKISRAGYNIVENANQLREIYFNSQKKNN